MKYLAIPFLVLFGFSSIAADIDYRALGTNGFYTNGALVNSKYWTNQSGTFRYQPGTGPVVNGQPGPAFTLRSDGSTFVGTNVFQDIAPDNSALIHPYVVSMTDSNEANTIRAGWWAIDSEDYGVYGGAELTVQQSGSSLLNLSADSGPISTLLRLNSTPGASDILLNETTDRFLASANATNVIQANAVGQNWIMTGQTNAESTIRVRADGSTFIGTQAALEEAGFGSVAQADFDRRYSPAIASMVDSNGPSSMYIDSILIDNPTYGYESEFFVKQDGNGGSPTTHLQLYAHINGGSTRSRVDLLADPLFSQNAITIRKNGPLVFAVDPNGDLVEIKDVTYSWPVWDGDAVGNVLTTTNTSGSLDWQPGLLSTTGTNIVRSLATNVVQQNIGPGTNNFLAKFTSSGVNVTNSPLYSDSSNYVVMIGRPDGNAYTNSATNRMYGEWTSAGNNQYMEWVVPQGHNSEFAHIRHTAVGQTSQRSAIVMNDAWYFEPGDQPQVGHAAGAILPLSDNTRAIGNSSLRINSIEVGTGYIQIGIPASTSFPGLRIGASEAGVSSRGVNDLSFWRPTTGITAAFDRERRSGSLQLDLAGNYLGFGVGISNTVCYLGGNDQVIAGLGMIGFVQVGTNNNTVALPIPAGFIGAPGVGTDRGGTPLVLHGGANSGSAKAGGFAVATTRPIASGTSWGTYTTNYFISANPVTLTESSATTVFSVTIGTGTKAFIKVLASTEGDDATDQTAVQDTFEVIAINKSGTITTAITTPGAETSTTLGTGGATLTTAWTAVDGTGKVDVKCNAVCSLTQTTLRVLNFQVWVHTTGVGTITVP